MARVAILYCKRIQDHSCIACMKCHKGIRERNGEFARHDTIELVAMTDCGDCPGLAVPRVKLLKETARLLETGIDVVHLGTCIKTAIDTGKCPIDTDELALTLRNRLGVATILGTHTY